LSFDENYISKAQKKTADMVIKAVKKNLKFGSSTNTVLGLNPWKNIEIDEVRKSDDEIKNIKKYADFYVKVIFDFDETLKKLIFISTSKTQEYHNALYHLWMGILDFPISDQIIFGRASTLSQHGSGTYGFGFLDLPMPDLQGRLIQLTPENVTQFLNAITQADNHMELLENIQNNTQAREQMRTMHLLMKNKEQRGIEIIDKLNLNKDLIKLMKSVGHFGSSKLRIFMVSRMISLSEIPLTAGEADYYSKRGGIRLFSELPDLLESKAREMEEALKQSDRDVFSILNIKPKADVSAKFFGQIGSPDTKFHKADSDIDISTFCLPGKSNTLFQLTNYEPTYDNSLRAINALINALKKFS